MYYYFDESGNWENKELEKKRFVISGLLIEDEDTRIEVEQTLQLFKAKYGNVVHATDIKNREQKEELYSLIYEIIKKDNIKILSFYFQPKSLYSQTKKEPDELYIEVASTLISSMAFSDENIQIDYDMKFHHSHPLSVLEHIKEKKKTEYAQMQKNFNLAEEKFHLNRSRILNILSTTLGKNRNKSSLQSSYDLLSGSNNEEQKIFIEKYLWTEFQLKIEKSGYLREKFKDTIAQQLETQYKEFGLEYNKPKIKIKYQMKQKQSAGVQIIDVLCNLIYHHGSSVKGKNVSQVVEEIYDILEVRDITNEKI